MLDKFYTKPDIANLCYKYFTKVVKVNKEDIFLEPSAGSGNFIDILEQNNHKFIAYDIMPDSEKIIKQDFLSLNVFPNVTYTIGNPPFGKKSKLAVEFILKCLSISKAVGFILPIQFRKYSVQKRIPEKYELIYDIDIPEDSFLVNEKNFSLRCCFQIWISDRNILKEEMNDLRVKKPITKHSDFSMYQYNHTPETLVYFDYDWDFAVYRQGFLDYTKKFYSKEELFPEKQYIFFKANSKKVLNNLLSLDFEKLSKKNIRIPGFGKADVIEEYNNKFKNVGIDAFF